MRLKYVFHGKNKEIHPFLCLNPTGNPLVRPPVGLESYMEEVKSHLAEIEITKPKCNLSVKKHQTLTEIKQNTDINMKKAGQGKHYSSHETKLTKIREGQNTNRRWNITTDLSPKPMVKENTQQGLTPNHGSSPWKTYIFIVRNFAHIVGGSSWKCFCSWYRI